jgi:hypothetical protein
MRFRCNQNLLAAIRTGCEHKENNIVHYQSRIDGNERLMMTLRRRGIRGRVLRLGMVSVAVASLTMSCTGDAPPPAASPPPTVPVPPTSPDAATSPEAPNEHVFNEENANAECIYALFKMIEIGTRLCGQPITDDRRKKLDDALDALLALIKEKEKPEKLAPFLSQLEQLPSLDFRRDGECDRDEVARWHDGLTKAVDENAIPLSTEAMRPMKYPFLGHCLL